MLGAHTALMTVGLRSAISYTTCICLSGFFAGPLIPSAMTWMDRYIEMTAFAFAFMSVGMSVGGFLSNWLSGTIFQNEGAHQLFVWSVSCGVALTVLVVIGQILGCIHGDRYHAMKKQLQAARSKTEEDCEPLIKES